MRVSVQRTEIHSSSICVSVCVCVWRYVHLASLAPQKYATKKNRSQPYCNYPRKYPSTRTHPCPKMWNKWTSFVEKEFISSDCGQFPMKKMCPQNIFRVFQIFFSKGNLYTHTQKKTPKFFYDWHGMAIAWISIIIFLFFTILCTVFTCFFHYLSSKIYFWFLIFSRKKLVKKQI